MDEFCGSQFWDVDLTWNTERTKEPPDLTPCFQNTVLVWVPCLFLWIFFILNLIFDSSSAEDLNLDEIESTKHKNQVKNKKSSENVKIAQLPIKSSRVNNSKNIIPWNALNVSKVVICVLLIITQLIRLVNSLTLKLSNFIIYPVDTYTPLLQISTYTLVLASIVISKWKGVRSSVIQFTFWSLLVACQLVKFRTTILAVYKEISVSPRLKTDYLLTQILELIDYPLILGQLLLHCWADSSNSNNGVKYNNSISLDNAADKKSECPEKSASALSCLLFSWFDSLAWKGHQKSLKMTDLWELNPEDTAQNASSVFEDILRKQSSEIKSNQNKRVGVFSALVDAFGRTFFGASVLRFVQSLLAFVSPQILNLLIAWITSDEDAWKGYFYAALMFGQTLFSSCTRAHSIHITYMITMKVKSCLMSVIYKKSLVMSNAAKKESTIGEIVNLMSVDVQNILNAIPYLNVLWAGPLSVTLSLYFLWDILGPSVLSGVGVMLILIPVNTVLGKLLRSFQIRQMRNKDERVKLISEILSGIKVILQACTLAILNTFSIILKLYAWEPSFQAEVMKIRRKEIKTLTDAAYVDVFADFLYTCSLFMVAIATFATYVLVDEKNVLDAQKVFVSLALINMMAESVTFFPMVISLSIKAAVSLRRIDKFMNAEDIDTAAVSHDDAEKSPIVIANGCFSWDRSDDSRINAQSTHTGDGDKNVLKNINLNVEEGTLVAVVGSVGSGKSSLLSAILGELEKISGRVNTKGSISYTGQIPWIQSGSLIENVLFGKSFEGRKYNKIIDACALGPDLDIFPGRDKVEIGEKGINLSGGQKQRVSIARAVYNNSDLYLLDDPLSAVDSHVGKHIFEKVLSSKGLLGRKTRVLVTNALHFLPQVDHIIVMKNGRISESGTYEQLLRQKGEFSDLISHYSHDLDVSSGPDIDSKTKSDIVPKIARKISLTAEFQTQNSNKIESVEEEDQIHEEQKKLIYEETMETSGVKWSIYLDYFRAAGWGKVISAVVVFILYQGFAIGSSFWLNVWSSEPIVNGTQGNRDLYLGVYAGLGIMQSLLFMLATGLLCFGVISSASVFHLNMLARILRAPMSFFDTTPSGRIVNRFAKDVDVLDSTLSYMFRTWINKLIAVLGTLFIIVYSTPIFIVVVIPISIFYYFVQKFFVPTSRQLKRLESVTRSPIYSHFSETLNGASTIRAYGQQHRFISESDSKLDENTVCYFPTIVSARWLAIRLEGAGSLIVLFAALFAVLSRDSLNPGLVGLSITYALQITVNLSILVRAVSDVEANIVAVERLKEYGEAPQEAPWKSSLRKPPNTWPAYGSIEFKNYQTRYRDGMDLVLKNITCSIEPGEKIGVVGRTGAGKSSLTLALFRIIESVGRGTITIDGEDIQKLGLHDVRSRLTIIPQDPILFSGTLRFNLDPFSKYSDNAVWRALEMSELKSFVEGLQGGLEFKVSEGGDNLSVGQKQLVCLSRAVLRKSKILVLDEATAAMDLETDDLIQKTIRSEFKDSTVITIAHRLNTIMDTTRVMVIDNGTIREFDAPDTLLENTESQFYGMAMDAGLIKSNTNEELN